MSTEPSPRITIASGEVLPTIESELCKTVTDQIRGEQASSVLGLLIDRRNESRRRSVTAPAIAGYLGKSLDYVELTLGMLEREGFAEPVEEHGITKFVAAAPDIPQGN